MKSPIAYYLAIQSTHTTLNMYERSYRVILLVHRISILPQNRVSISAKSQGADDQFCPVNFRLLFNRLLVDIFVQTTCEGLDIA